MQANVEDSRLGVLEYAIEKLRADVVRGEDKKSSQEAESAKPQPKLQQARASPVSCYPKRTRKAKPRIPERTRQAGHIEPKLATVRALKEMRRADREKGLKIIPITVNEILEKQMNGWLK